jgi:hypothetical protein
VVGPDTDGDGLADVVETNTGTFVDINNTGTDPLDPDTDGDGCADGEELGPNEGLGGRRNPLSFWDFFDTPELGATPTRDRAVTLGDIFRVAGRFGATGTPGDPLSTPDPAPAYHSSYDRSSPLTEAQEPDPDQRELWDLQAADGAITVSDIFMIAAQFGHTCVAVP